MSAVLDRLIANLPRLRPEVLEAVDVLVRMHVEAQTPPKKQKRPSLLAQLHGVHRCPDVHLGFTQIRPSGSGERRWTCCGCNAIVRLSGEE